MPLTRAHYQSAVSSRLIPFRVQLAHIFRLRLSVTHHLLNSILDSVSVLILSFWSLILFRILLALILNLLKFANMQAVWTFLDWAKCNKVSISTTVLALSENWQYPATQHATFHDDAVWLSEVFVYSDLGWSSNSTEYFEVKILPTRHMWPVPRLQLRSLSTLFVDWWKNWKLPAYSNLPLPIALNVGIVRKLSVY